MDSKGSYHKFVFKTDPGEDPVEKMIKETGCLELHHQVQSCIFESGDWRKCQDIVEEFKECMNNYKERMKEKSN